MPPHVLCGLRGPPSWAWQECNRLLRLGRPRGAVTLSRWCVSGDRGGCSARRALNLNSTNLPRPWSPRESSPSRKIPTVEPGIEPIDGRPVHRTAIYRCDDTRGCIIQFRPPDNERMVLETCRGMK